MFIRPTNPFYPMWAILLVDVLADVLADLFQLKHIMLSCLNLFNPLTAKLFNLNFHPLEAVSR